MSTSTTIASGSGNAWRLPERLLAALLGTNAPPPPSFAADPLGAAARALKGLVGAAPPPPAELPPLSHGARLALALAATLAALLLTQLLSSLLDFVRLERALRRAPRQSVRAARGGHWLLGHVLPLLRAPTLGVGAWDVMESWLVDAKKELDAEAKGAEADGNGHSSNGDGRNGNGAAAAGVLPPPPPPLVRFRILGTSGLVVGDPWALKRVFQSRFKTYAKDLRVSYGPFLPILGTGLVTADGDLWQKQRLLIGPALRVDILDDIVPIARRAADRLSEKLAALRGTGASFSIEEEFRLLTLQVIGEAVLSLPAEDCDRVFPQLYLPVMEEANKRVLLPYRKWLPTPDWWSFRSRMRALNGYLVGVIRDRWRARLEDGDRPEQQQQQQQQGGAGAAAGSGGADAAAAVVAAAAAANGGGGGGGGAGGRGGRGGGKQQAPPPPPPRRADILDRVLAAIEASGARWSAAIETQLCYELKTFLLAGHETSAAMLTWSTFELARGGGRNGGSPSPSPSPSPSLAKVRAEAKRVFGAEATKPGAYTTPRGDPPRRDVDAGLEYTLSVLKEALRRYSVVPVVTRLPREDDEMVPGVVVPRGTMVVCHLQHVHNQWQDAEAFKPERFLPGGEYDQFDEAIRPYMFLPFIQGPRNCLGQHLALLEARVVLALLSARFTFRFADKAAAAGKRHPTVIPVASECGMMMTVE
jgi:cytochrome P450